MNFEGKTILITGASSGIGKAIAQKLAQFNCKLILIARRTNLIEDYIGGMNNRKAEVIIEKCDVSKKEEVQDSMNRIKTRLADGQGKINNNIDIAILNAAASYRVDVTEFNSAYAEEIFGVNVFGIIYWLEQLLPSFMKNRKGMIIGVSSLADSRGHAKSEFYCASKSAVTKLLEGFRVELHPYNVKVITVKPGFVRTPLISKNKFRMPMLMEPEKAADIIINGIKKEKNIIAFPWPIAFASWLGGIVPSKVYEFFAKRVKVR